MAREWTAEPHTRADKSFYIKGPSELWLMVDYDDVPHEEVDAEVERLLALLNTFMTPSDPAEGLEVTVRETGERFGFHWEPDCSARSMLAKLGNEIVLRRRREEELKAGLRFYADERMYEYDNDCCAESPQRWPEDHPALEMPADRSYKGGILEDEGAYARALLKEGEPE